MISTGALEITPEILNIIAEIDEFKGSWKALALWPLSASPRLSALRRVATIESETS